MSGFFRGEISFSMCNLMESCRKLCNSVHGLRYFTLDKTHLSVYIRKGRVTTNLVIAHASQKRHRDNRAYR